MKNRTTNHLMRAATLASTVLVLNACGAGLKPADSSGSPSSNPQASGTAPTTNPPVQNSAWATLSMNGTPSFGDFKLFQVVSIDKATKSLVLTLPLPPNPYVDGITLSPIQISQLPGSTLSIAPIASGGSALTFRVPLVDIIKKDISFPAATTLPNGDPLPKVADGSLPSAAVTINNIKNVNATLYFSVQQLGIFINTPFDPMIGLSIPIKNEDGTRTWGYLTSVPAKHAPATMDGGFFISIQIPDDIARIIDNNL